MLYGKYVFLLQRVFYVDKLSEPLQKYDRLTPLGINYSTAKNHEQPVKNYQVYFFS